MYVKKLSIKILKSKRLSLYFGFDTFYLYFYFLGPLGKTLFKIDKKYFQLSAFFPLQFYVTTIFINTFLKSFKNKLLGIIKGFHVVLVTRGLGYRFRVKRFYKNTPVVRLKLGLKHNYLYRFPPSALVSSIKYRLFIFCNEKDLLPRITSELRQLRYPDIYKGKGIRFNAEPLNLKVGKQR